ncbi:FAD-dependent monooxygenase [Jhaorihella thermophila]|uniref:Salicylate hydroxylase n=1 Tax=Jhaorihella thermophila TaxID=488547 RepID=A0A1H5WVR1_9RHOB|nr:FAD-dependent monooxygenase [Jhaorihella thermophila]SEG03581.1 salicylate hydroxylase [Jhaorihella thermophila]
MSLNGLRVKVVGAGIGGLAAALALRARGAEVTVLEQAPELSEVGAGLQISPNGVAVLRVLGLEPALAQEAVRGRAVVLRDHAGGDAVLRLDLARHAPDLAYYFVHRADLIDLLTQAAREADIGLRLLQRVAAVEPGAEDADRAVLRMASGAEIAADLVIGADGLHSRARAVLNGADDPFFTGQVAWRAVVPNVIGLGPEAQVFMGPGRHLVCYPLRRGDLVNIVAVQERREWAAEGWHHADDPDNLRAAFADFGGDARRLLAQVDEVNLWGLFRHPVADCWQRGRLAILGDAAHPTLPFMAQGANMALEDAWVLADCLERGADLGAALAAYQARRRPRVARVIAAANGNAWKYHLRPGPVRGLAHLALRLGGSLAPGRMVRQFDWIYRHDVTAGPA